MSLYHWLYEKVKMKRWRWVEHIVVGKHGQNRKAWAHLTITSQPVQCFHTVENKVSCCWKNIETAIGCFFLHVLSYEGKNVCLDVGFIQNTKTHAHGCKSNGWYKSPSIRLFKWSLISAWTVQHSAPSKSWHSSECLFPHRSAAALIQNTVWQ